jgi:hypothetical protein
MFFCRLVGYERDNVSIRILQLAAAIPARVPPGQRAELRRLAGDAVRRAEPPCRARRRRRATTAAGTAAQLPHRGLVVSGVDCGAFQRQRDAPKCWDCPRHSSSRGRRAPITHVERAGVPRFPASGSPDDPIRSAWVETRGLLRVLSAASGGDLSWCLGSIRATLVRGLG